MQNPVESIKKFVRATNYLSVAQIYLKDNFLLKRPLVSLDIKPKLFGHWGTCPAINFTYAYANYLAKKYNQSTIFVLGPGHGFPALQANLFLEGSLGKYYPKASLDSEGIGYVSKSFAWPYGFSSHSTPEAPGIILEGGELGYSLATAFGAVLDNPDLLAVCMIGDGEAETGPIATAWHINKLIDPKNNGAVLPVLNVNGLKISGPTIFGRMSDEELITLFSGYGYEPFIVEGENIYEKMLETVEKSYEKIKAIQTKARNGEKTFKPRFPMIILRSPKGWTTIKELRGQNIEGTIAAHQVVMPNVAQDEEELSALETWLQSYKFEELFDEAKGFDHDIVDLLPSTDLRIGDNKYVFGPQVFQELQLPNAKQFEKPLKEIGEPGSNSMRIAGEFMRDVFVLNKEHNNFRLMSPDETYSNRLDAVFDVTSRAFAWPIEPTDKHMGSDGRIMELLSEHNLHGLAQGYILTGRHTVFATYEAFAQIISSMAHTYIKFLKFAKAMPWRTTFSSMNYILSSTAWRQEHNGFSHQNVSFISGMLDKHNCFTHVYFPVDDNSMLAIMQEVLSSKDQVNTIVAGKTPEPRWLTLSQAQEALKDGLAIWNFASDTDPDIVIAGVGDYVTKEALAAVEIIKKEASEIKVRFVNIMKLSGACNCEDKSHQITHPEKYFTTHVPVILNFHGYPEVMKSILFDVTNPQRFSIHGYKELGGTTTPFDMHVRNETSRYHLAIETFQKMAEANVLSAEKATVLIEKYKKAIDDHTMYIKDNGADPKDIENWQWGNTKATNILQGAKTIAVIGLSDNPQRHSHRVASYFKEKGFRVIPINPNITEVLGEKAYPDLLSVPKEIQIDIVDIFRRPEEVIAHLEEVLKRGGISNVWLQEGVGSLEAERFADDYGINLVSNFCILEAYKKIEKE